METTHREIVEYWLQHQSECDLSVDWSEAEMLCWRCSQKRLLQRCHVVPRALGGTDNPSNLVLLCGQCHKEAPNVQDPDFMWVWLRAHAVSHYGTYWLQQGFREYEFIYKRKPFEGFEDSHEIFLVLQEAIQKYLRHTSTHWGQGKINPATVAWLIRKVEQEVQS